MTKAEGSEETDQRTLNYMLDKVKKLVHITHPFPNSPFNQAILEIYENGRLIRKERISIFKGPEILQYLNHFFLTIWLFIKLHSAFDLCIALENLSFISLFYFRYLGFIKRIVYYSVDFTPQRFTNPLLNNLYHSIDKFACTRSDINWVMVKEQIKARKNRDRGKIKYSPFVLAGIGYKRSLIKISQIREIDFYNIIFAGGLLENSGPHLGIQTLPYLVKKFPKIHYTIVGKGAYEDTLKESVKKLNLERYVIFTGYIKSFQKMTQVLSKASIGLAPFAPKSNSLSYFSDPSKIKLYLVCGLPVITTEVTTIAPLIQRTKSGIIIDFNEKSLYKALDYLLSNKRRYQSYKKAAIKLSQKYDIDNILTEAFKKIPN